MEGRTMKVCERCGEEIGTKDGENRCAACEDKARRSRRSNLARKMRDQAMRDCGLVKVRGALGGTYWE